MKYESLPCSLCEKRKKKPNSSSQVTHLLMSLRGLKTACKHMNKDLLIIILMLTMQETIKVLTNSQCDYNDQKKTALGSHAARTL